MSMPAEPLQTSPSLNCLDLAGNWPSHPVHTDPVIRKIMADPGTRENLLPFMNWAWKRGFLQPKRSEHIPSCKPVTEVEAMNWLEIVNKTDNDLGLIIIRIYQQSMWPSLVQLVVHLLERQLLPGSVSSKRSPHSRIYFSSFTQDKDKSKISAISAPSTQERKRR